MTNAMTLDDLRKKADEKYAPYTIEIDGETLTLRNPIRVEKEKRDRVMDLVEEIQELQELLTDDEDNPKEKEIPQGEVIDSIHQTILEIIDNCADSVRLGEILIDECRKDFGVAQTVFFDWFGADEVGEASNSPAE